LLHTLYFILAQTLPYAIECYDSTYELIQKYWPVRAIVKSRSLLVINRSSGKTLLETPASQRVAVLEPIFFEKIVAETAAYCFSQYVHQAA